MLVTGVLSHVVASIHSLQRRQTVNTTIDIMIEALATMLHFSLRTQSEFAIALTRFDEYGGIAPQSDVGLEAFNNSIDKGTADTVFSVNHRAVSRFCRETQQPDVRITRKLEVHICLTTRSW